MTVRARQLTLATAAVLFVVLAILTLGQVSGWHFDNGRIVRSAGLFIDSRPRATVLVNGLAVGSTPYRTSSLDADRVTVALQRSGYHSWSRPIALSRGEALSIATVRLLPIVEPGVVTAVEEKTFFSGSGGQSLWSVSPLATGQFMAQAFGDPTYALPVSVPFTPTEASVSPDGIHVYFRSPTAAGVLSRQQDWWPTVLVDRPQWSPDRSSVLFGLQNGRLVQIDLFARRVTTDQSVTSFALSGGSIWGATLAADETVIWRADPSVLSGKRTVFRLPGAWSFLTAPTGTLVIQSQSGAGRLISGNSTLGFRLSELGSVDTVLSSRSGDPLTWAAGSDVSVRQGQRPSLIDRLARSVVWAGWFHAPDAMVVFDGQSIALYEKLNSKRWYLITRQELPADTRFLAGSGQGDGFWYESAGQVYFWSWR